MIWANMNLSMSCFRVIFSVLMVFLIIWEFLRRKDFFRAGNFALFSFSQIIGFSLPVAVVNPLSLGVMRCGIKGCGNP